MFVDIYSTRYIQFSTYSLNFSTWKMLQAVLIATFSINHFINGLHSQKGFLLWRKVKLPPLTRGLIQSDSDPRVTIECIYSSVVQMYLLMVVKTGTVQNYSRNVSSMHWGDGTSSSYNDSTIWTTMWLTPSGVPSISMTKSASTFWQMALAMSSPTSIHFATQCFSWPKTIKEFHRSWRSPKLELEYE